MWINRKDSTIQWEERHPATLSELAEAQLKSIARAEHHGPTYNPSSLSCSSCLNDECDLRYGAPRGVFLELPSE